MFQSLANRLTLWYAAVAVGLAVIVGAVYMLVGFVSIASNANQTIAQAQYEASDLAAISRSQGHTLAQDAPKIARELSRGSMHAAVFDDHGRLLGGSVPPAQTDNRTVPALLALLGSVPKELKVQGGTVVIGPDPTRMAARLRRFWETTLVVCLFVVAVVWLAFSRITRRALHPLVEVTTALQRFGSGDFKSRFIIDPGKRDEMVALTQAYNSAVDQVGAAFEQRRLTELQISQFIADAGHQLRTPLTVVMGFIEVLRKGTTRDPETEGRIFDAMTTESRRMRILIDKLVLLARLDQPHANKMNHFDLGALTSGVVESFSRLSGGERVTVQAGANAFVAADKSEIQEAISNLIDNALKYAAGSAVRVRVGVNNGTVVVGVQDFGPGIAPEEQKRIFDRFYRGSVSESVDGSGLGLAIVKRAVERAHGEIHVESQPGAGATFEIRLQRAR
ncbi:MAG: HAMP domain-containing histidine kinase [Candidatus Eremiobacteraeota bacterium]|nr:HAMP domain-containing histidine kinase [Candidatus Eremiobacteraeota bacterium]